MSEELKEYIAQELQHRKYRQQARACRQWLHEHEQSITKEVIRDHGGHFVATNGITVNVQRRDDPVDMSISTAQQLIADELWDIVPLEERDTVVDKTPWWNW